LRRLVGTFVALRRVDLRGPGCRRHGKLASAMALVTDPDHGEPEHDAPEPPAEDDAVDDGGGRPWWHSPWRLLVLGVALVFLGAAVSYAWTTVKDQPPAEGSVDVGFLQDMRLHHDQAVQMAWIYTRKDPAQQDPLLMQIAGEILLGQQFEAGVMAQQLRSWGRPEANMTGETMAWMGMPVPAERMVGMATQEQLEQLGNASGPAADKLFAELMIAHHEGGVHMAEFAKSAASTDEARTLATSMYEAQLGEIGELQKILDRL